MIRERTICPTEGSKSLPDGKFIDEFCINRTA
ncbi:MAG: hypothetical protein ACJATR_002552 [Halopseudomonas sp.]|jgi:hypothetical protein